jgi:preprotein translocase SecE subunit
MGERANKAAKAGKGVSGAAIAERETRVSDTAKRGRQGASTAQGNAAAGFGPAAGSAGASDRRGFFDIYKPGQGANTRTWSGVGYGALVVWFAIFLYNKFSVADFGSSTQIVQVGVAVTTIGIFGLLGYYFLGLNKKAGDFLIATEGEMKKVNWTTRKDIIGSTKVVIIVVVCMSIMLFLVDIFFMWFFSLIGVLESGS